MPIVIDTKKVMLSRKHLADWLGVSLNTISNMVERGEFPRPVRAGRQYRWTGDQIAEWLEQQRNQDNG